METYPTDPIRISQSDIPDIGSKIVDKEHMVKQCHRCNKAGSTIKGLLENALSKTSDMLVTLRDIKESIAKRTRSVSNPNEENE